MNLFGEEEKEEVWAEPQSDRTTIGKIYSDMLDYAGLVRDRLDSEMVFGLGYEITKETLEYVSFSIALGKKEIGRFRIECKDHKVKVTMKCGEFTRTYTFGIEAADKIMYRIYRDMDMIIYASVRSWSVK